MYGQMTAGSWIYIGSQGIIQGTYETFLSMAKKHFNGSLESRWILTGGLGGMGGAQPLASTMAGACMLAIECDETRIDKRLETGYCDYKATNLDEALKLIKDATDKKEVISVGLLGNAAEIFPEILKGDFLPDAVTDQTSAHDPLNGYLPIGWSMEKAKELRISNPDLVVAEAKKSMGVQVEAMLGFQAKGIANSTI